MGGKTIRTEDTPALLTNGVIEPTTPLIFTPEGEPISSQAYSPTQDELVRATLRELCQRVSQRAGKMPPSEPRFPERRGRRRRSSVDRQVYAFTLNVGDRRYCVDVLRGDVPLTDAADESQMEMKLTQADWLDVCRGRLNAQMAFMSGKMKISGDMGVLMRISSNVSGLFQVASAAIHADAAAKASSLVTEVNLRLIRLMNEDPSRMYSMTPRQFEELIADILAALGWQVELTSMTRDGGRDIVAVRCVDGLSLRTLVEAKRYDPKRPVPVGVVRQLYGVKQNDPSSKAVLATTSYVTEAARKEFQRVIPWEMEFREYDGIVQWLNEAAVRTDNR